MMVEDDLHDLERRLTEIIAAAQTLLGQVKATIAKSAREELKRPNGRLTDAGVSRLRAMIDAGNPDSKIARELGVTQSAVHHQRQNYLAERRVTRRIKRSAGD